MKIILALFCCALTFCFYGQDEQIKYVTISSNALDKNYRREIKIDLKTGDVYARKKVSKKFRHIKEVKNVAGVTFIKDSLSYEYLSKIVVENAWDIMGYKVEFMSKTCPNAQYPPCYSEIKSIEFKFPHDQKNKALLRLINIYFDLRTKAKI